jgi:ABC-type dipeptide/oligopeptide/nickel transport system ATPase component
MAQRAIIALGLFLNPSLLIADEPTTALDVISQDQIFKYLDRIKEETDTSMILITHDISVVFESCEKIAVMHGGQLAEEAAAVDLYDMPRHPYTHLLKQAFPDHRYPDEDLAVIEGVPPQTIGDIDSVPSSSGAAGDRGVSTVGPTVRNAGRCGNRRHRPPGRLFPQQRRTDDIQSKSLPAIN